MWGFCSGEIIKNLTLSGASNLAQREVRWEKRFVESLRLVQEYSRRTLTRSSPPPGFDKPVGSRRILLQDLLLRLVLKNQSD